MSDSLISIAIFTMLVFLSVPSLVFFMVTPIFIGSKIGMDECIREERFLGYSLVVSYAMICTFQTDLLVYLFFRTVMHTPFGEVISATMLTMGATFATMLTLMLVAFFYGRRHKTDLRLGRLGRFYLGSH